MKSLLNWTERRLLQLFLKLQTRQNLRFKVKMFSSRSKYFVYRKLKRELQKDLNCRFFVSLQSLSYRGSTVVTPWEVYHFLDFLFFLDVSTSFEVSAEPQGCYAVLSWETPSYNTCPITRYTVHYRQSNQLIKWQTTFIERNLTKYRLRLNCSSTYKIMVLAWNDRGSSIKDAKVLAVTTEEGIRVVMCFTNRGGLWRFWPLRINRRFSLFLVPALHYALLLGFRSLNFRHYFESLTPSVTSESTSFKAVQWRHYPKPGSDFDCPNICIIMRNFSGTVVWYLGDRLRGVLY